MQHGDIILKMRGITKTFAGVTALEDVTLEVRRGEIHAICGENGAGKSTLMKVLSGVHPYGTYAGDIVLDGEVCEFKSIRDSEERGIVIIHQELALSPYLSIAENIFLGNENARRGVIDWNETSRKASELLARVGLDERPETRIADIGVGKQQLVEIAKALSRDVRLLILDEPTAALNDDDSAHLLQLLDHLRSQGITCIMISHKLNEIEAISDTITVIRDGRTIETLSMCGAEKIEESRIIQGMVGRPLEARFPERESEIGDEVLRLQDWTVHHPLDPSRQVVKQASLTVRRGEVVGLAGLMGAGRTELAMSLFGHTYGVGISGAVYKDGEPIDTSTVSKAIASGIAYVSEDRKVYGLNLIQSVKENVTAAGLDRLARAGVIDVNAESEVAERYRGELRIKSPSVEVSAGSLSGGNQQKVVLAKWIYTDPDVLILDEPTRGIDVGAKYEIYSIINALVARGKAILFISSELPELLGVCDRIYAIHEGSVVAEVPRAEATQEKLMRYMTTNRKAVEA